MNHAGAEPTFSFGVGGGLSPGDRSSRGTPAVVPTAFGAMVPPAAPGGGGGGGGRGGGGFVHSNVACDLCGASPIVGQRFRSKKVLNYDVCGGCIRTQAAEEMAPYEEVVGKSLG